MDFLDARKADLPGRLHILGLRNEDTLLVFQQRTLEKQNRAILLESMYQNDVLAVQRVTGHAPLQFFTELAVENNGPQGHEFFQPFFRFTQISVNLGIHSALSE